MAPWYLYPETNFGSAVGFFANVNHMGTLLVITFPFVAALAAMPRGRDRQRDAARLALCGGLALVVIVGIALNGSFAAYGLGLPVLAASALILFPAHQRLRFWAPLAIALLLVASIAVLEVTPIGAEALSKQATTSVQSRQEIFATTSKAINDFFPWGSGLGSFTSVYHLYENPQQVTSTYVVHAHNDYLELALEMGLPGIILMLAFIIYWAAAAWQSWRAPGGSAVVRAASIASSAIIAHSIFDFPLRTAAISASLGVCLALLARPRTLPQPDAEDLRPSRHITLR